MNDQTDSGKIEVEALLSRNPRHSDPMGQRIDIAVKMRGTEVFHLEDKRQTQAELGRDLALASLEFADGIYTRVLRALRRAGGGTELNEPESYTHPLRREIDQLRKELADVTHRMTTAETQRDELRRLFAQPEITYADSDRPLVVSSDR